MRERTPIVPIDGIELRTAPEFPSLRASSDGRIMGRYGRWLKPRVERSGYLCVGITRNGASYPVRVHVVVCTAFHGARPGPEYEVAHGNGDRTDNRAENLRWATHQENVDDMWRHGTMLTGERRYNAKLTAEKVREIRARRETGSTVKSLAEEFGVSCGLIQNVVSPKRERRTWAHII